MDRILAAGILTLCSVALIPGCNGPTKTGLEARLDAQNRLGLVNAEITYDQAKRNFEVGRFDQALRQIEATIARAPQRPQYYVLHGRILIETHRLEMAERTLARAIELDPNSHEAHYFTGILHQRWSNDQRAYESYMEASTIEPSNAQYLLAAAESLVAMGQLNEAEQVIRPRLDYFEHNAALHHLLGQIAMLQGQPAKAVDLYARCITLKPDDELMLEEMARAQYAAGQFSRCLESVERLNDRTGMVRADMTHLKARCLAMLNRNVEARDLYIKLTSLRPGDVTVWSELGMVAWDQGDDRRIAECASRVLAMAPARYEGYMLQGVHEQNAGRDAEALRMFREAANRAGTAPLPHMLLGRQLEAMGDPGAARNAYAAALKLEPDNETARTLFNRIDPSSQVTAVPDR